MESMIGIEREELDAIDRKWRGRRNAESPHSRHSPPIYTRSLGSDVLPPYTYLLFSSCTPKSDSSPSITELNEPSGLETCRLELKRLLTQIPNSLYSLHYSNLQLSPVKRISKP
jgi:hypothetical protein